MHHKPKLFEASSCKQPVKVTNLMATFTGNESSLSSQNIRKQ